MKTALAGLNPGANPASQAASSNAPAKTDASDAQDKPQFDRLMAELRIIAPAIGRSICVEPVARRGWGR